MGPITISYWQDKSLATPLLCLGDIVVEDKVNASVMLMVPSSNFCYIITSLRCKLCQNTEQTDTSLLRYTHKNMRKKTEINSWSHSPLRLNSATVKCNSGFRNFYMKNTHKYSLKIF